MNTSNDMSDKSSYDPVDQLIFDHKLRAKTVFSDKDLDVFLILFSNGQVLKARLSDYPKLKNATKEELDDWRLIKKGIGIRWDSLDEDISIKGFIKDVALKNTLRNLTSETGDRVVPV